MIDLPPTWNQIILIGPKAVDYEICPKEAIQEEKHQAVESNGIV